MRRVEGNSVEEWTMLTLIARLVPSVRGFLHIKTVAAVGPPLVEQNGPRFLLLCTDQ